MVGGLKCNYSCLLVIHIYFRSRLGQRDLPTWPNMSRFPAAVGWHHQPIWCCAYSPAHQVFGAACLGTDLKIGQPPWTPTVTFIFPSRLWTTPFSYTPKWCCNVLYNHPPTSRLGDVSGIATTCHYPQPARPLRSFRAPCHCGRWLWRRVWWTIGPWEKNHIPQVLSGNKLGQVNPSHGKSSIFNCWQSRTSLGSLVIKPKNLQPRVRSPAVPAVVFPGGLCHNAVTGWQTVV